MEQDQKDPLRPTMAADSGPSSIYSLQGGSTVLWTIRGYERLDPKLRAMIARTLAALPPLAVGVEGAGREEP